MQYRIISTKLSGAFTASLDDRALERHANEVNAAMASGWEPLGNIVVYGGRLVQAMIKRR